MTKPFATIAWRAVTLLFLLVLSSLVGCRGHVPATEPAAAPTVAERVPDDWAYDLTAPTPTAPRGMVATDAERATEVGKRILERGGNAVDAAVATTFALAVVYPEAGNIGGGGFMVARMDGATAALDFREEAPQAATRDMYLGENGEPTDSSVVGYRASGVPGTVAGMRKAWERFGSMPWADLLEPAIALAAEGFPVSERFAAGVQRRADVLRRFPASRELFLPGGQPLQAGQTWKNPDLAATLRRVAEQGRAGFYRGQTARLLAEEMQRGGGLITRADLRRYEAKWRRPVGFRYRGHRVYGMPPPSSGGLTMGIAANILGAYDLGESSWHAPRSLHLMTEAMRRAFAARNHYLGDPDYTRIPRDSLLSRGYADRMRATISRKKATPSRTVSPQAGRDGQPTVHTTHLSIVDEAGNAVALTTTINFLYGSKVAVGGAGFLLNNEMNDFTAQPGEPNAYGLVQGEANAVGPGKRPLSSMSPTLVLGADGEPLLVTGARGGPRIITAAFQVMSNVLDYGFDLGAAVRAPRIHHQHLPDKVFYEPNGLTPGLAKALQARDHTLEQIDAVGNAPTIRRTLGGRWAGMSDPRGSGVATGY
ncbi:MAG: gamma-glutamyltransferase [Bacteroidetes bacterium QS_9_68_14]|nr:MAG: gamma-glutamyltransferase [Bacteroidetes bacterium QS_9_68_14]